MADKKKRKKTKKDKKEIEKKKDFLKEVKIAYRGLENPKKFYTTILFPLIIIGIIVFLMPLILTIIVPFPLNMNPISFIVGGIVPIILGVLYPYITWKRNSGDTITFDVPNSSAAGAGNSIGGMYFLPTDDNTIYCVTENNTCHKFIIFGYAEKQ